MYFMVGKLLDSTNGKTVLGTATLIKNKVLKTAVRLDPNAQYILRGQGETVIIKSPARVRCGEYNVQVVVPDSELNALAFEPA
jgi:hypothetical protein